MRPTSNSQKNRLFTLLKEQSFQRGRFTLASGKQSDYYMDCRLTTLDGEGAYLLGSILYTCLAPHNIDAVGGMTMGADPIVSSIIYRSAEVGAKPLKGFIVRKETKSHGARKQIEGNLKPWMRIALVEDVVTSGGSTEKAIQAIRQNFPDIVITQIIAVVDRQAGASQLFQRLGIPFQALFSVDAFLQE
ncbi:MAG: orotate phosphoribosyltransferase [Cyanobacteria bacterium P01_H01_bin.74]